MKRLVLGGLSLLLVVATTTPVTAAAAISPQVHTTAASISQTPVSPWLIRVNETRASQLAVVQPTTISTAAVSTQSIPVISPWLALVNQTRGSLHTTLPTAGHTAKLTASITSNRITMFDQNDGR